MASHMKGLFREKKKLGISKPKSSITKPKSSNLKPKRSADVVQLVDLQEDYDEKEEVLRQFDMNMAYGPCLGMNRLDRWNRANAWGLNPPKEVENLLRVNSECLWDGRV